MSSDREAGTRKPSMVVLITVNPFGVNFRYRQGHVLTS